MEFQHNLINRKEYFGLVWLAAHRPSKLSKIEIIQMDLSKKCKQLNEYIVNGKSAKNKPKLSLLISSHLMYGLVVLLHKKNTYLFDELMLLKTQIFHSNVILSSKQTLKTSKKSKVSNRSSITLKENFPEMLNYSSIESMVFNKPDVSYLSKITLNDDFIDASTIIPVEYNYQMDSFGFDQYQHHQDMEKTINGEILIAKPSYTSTAQKAESTRVPFRDVTNLTNEYQRKEELQSILRFEELEGQQNVEYQMDQMHFDFLNVCEPVALFEPTVIENGEIFVPSIGSVLMPVADELNVEKDLADQTIVTTTGITKTFSADIHEIQNQQTKKKANILARKKPRNLIIDAHTELIIDEDERLRRMGRANVANSDHMQKILFREKNTWLITKNDYFLTDLFKQPSSLEARKNRFHLSEAQSIRNRLIIQNKNMFTATEPDHTHFYLTEARNRKRALVPEINVVPDETSPSKYLITENSALEQAREHISTMNLGANTEISKLGKSKRHGSILNPVEEFMPMPMQHSLTDRNMESEAMELPLFQEQPLLMESFREQTSFLPEAQRPVVQATEIGEYEALIIKNMLKNERVNLQDLICQSKLPTKLENNRNPRRLFAAKMFETVLKLAAKQTICVDQKEQYGPIVLSGINL